MFCYFKLLVAQFAFLHHFSVDEEVGQQCGRKKNKNYQRVDGLQESMVS